MFRQKPVVWRLFEDRGGDMGGGSADEATGALGEMPAADPHENGRRRAPFARPHPDHLRAAQLLGTIQLGAD
jgi:hypothetical protein